MVQIPTTLAAVQDAIWLTEIMQAAAPGSRVEAVETLEIIRVVASKVRVRLTYAAEGPAGPTELCIKGFFDTDPYMDKLSYLSANEAQFYARIANSVPMRVARSPFSAIDPATGLGLVVMDDLTAKGARFMSALEPYGVARARQSVAQLAALHASYAGADPAEIAWAPSVIEPMAAKTPLGTAELQTLLDGERGLTLSGGVLDAARIHRALTMLADIDRDAPRTLLHGDCHAGNVFDTAEGPGFTDWQLVQRGHWALDVAYHLGAVLTVEEGAAHERALLTHYLESYAAAGGTPPPADQAWDDFCRATLYGYYLWIVTLRVDSAITHEFCHRLGHAMIRHESLDRIEASQR